MYSLFKFCSSMLMLPCFLFRALPHCSLIQQRQATSRMVICMRRSVISSEHLLKLLLHFALSYSFVWSPVVFENQLVHLLHVLSQFANHYHTHGPAMDQDSPPDVVQLVTVLCVQSVKEKRGILFVLCGKNGIETRTLWQCIVYFRLRRVLIIVNCQLPTAQSSFFPMHWQL